MGLISLITIVIKILMSSGYDINGWSFDHPFVFHGDWVRVTPVFYQYFNDNKQKLNFVYKPFWCGVRVIIRKELLCNNKFRCQSKIAKSI